MNQLPFLTLLYRYFFFSWLFKEVDGADVFERAAKIRFNRQQARWLPTYLLRWLWLGLGLYAIASVLELVLQAPDLMVMLFYAASAMSVAFTVSIGTAWLGMRGAHHPQ